MFSNRNNPVSLSVIQGFILLGLGNSCGKKDLKHASPYYNICKTININDFTILKATDCFDVPPIIDKFYILLIINRLLRRASSQ